MAFQDGDTAGNGLYTWHNGGWHETATLPKAEPVGSIETGTPGKLPPTPTDWGAVGRDVKNTTAPGLARGVVGAVTAPKTAMDLIERGASYAADKAGVPEANIKATGKLMDEYGYPALGPIGAIAKLPSYGSAINSLESSSGPLYQPQSDPGKYWNALLEAAPASVAGGGPGSAVAKLGRGGSAALASEAAGQWAQGSPYENIWRMVGLLGGSTGPAAVRKVVTPNPASPELTGQANILRQAGVPVSASQATGRTEGFLGKLEGLTNPVNASQQERAVTKAFNKAAGVNSDTYLDASGKSIWPGQKRVLGQKMDDLAARTNMQWDPHDPQHSLMKGILDARNKYIQAKGQDLPEFDKAAKSILGPQFDPTKPLNTQTLAAGMNGVNYQATRQALARQAASLRKTDPDLTRSIRGVKDAFDETMHASGGGEWKVLNKQYEASLALEKAAKRGATGQYDPKAVRSAVGDQSSELGALAGAAESVLQPLPKGGFGAKDIPSLVGGLGTVGLLNYKYGVPLHEAATPGIFAQMGSAAAVNSALGNPLSKKLINSKLMQELLANQRWLPGAATAADPGQAARLLLADPKLNPETKR